jgi:two-component system nitrogen regulation response regulator NtrX
MAALREYAWPGNVRELRNVLERVLIMVPGDTIEAHHLALPGMAATPDLDDDLREIDAPLQEARERFEKDYILRVLAANRGNMSRTADALGVERSNLYRKMKGFGIAPARRGEDDEDG